MAIYLLGGHQTDFARVWSREGLDISDMMREAIDGKIALLTRTRSRLDECIGCGCMSLERCQRTNRHDRAAGAGPGPRFVLVD